MKKKGPNDCLVLTIKISALTKRLNSTQIQEHFLLSNEFKVDHTQQRSACWVWCFCFSDVDLFITSRPFMTTSSARSRDRIAKALTTITIFEFYRYQLPLGRSSKRIEYVFGSIILTWAPLPLPLVVTLPFTAYYLPHWWLKSVCNAQNLQRITCNITRTFCAYQVYIKPLKLVKTHFPRRFPSFHRWTSLVLSWFAILLFYCKVRSWVW